MDELYIDNLDEYVQDEGKLVTYKWLSLTLNVPSNTAKQMLFHYVNKQRNVDKNVKLNVTYLISGVIYDEELKQDIHKVCVVCESKLNGIKETFRHIFSIHFYSVQKAQLHDLNLLYAADYDKVTENVYETSKYSGIICPSIQIRSSAEITSLKSKLAYKSSSPTKANLGKVKPALEPKPKVIDSENKENKFNAEGHGKRQETELQNNMQQKKTVLKGSKGGIASMFANQTKKNEDKKLDIASKGNIKVHLEEEKRPKKGTLSGFFTKEITVNKKTQDKVIKEELHANEKVEDSLKIEVKTEDIILDEEEDPLAKSPIKVETIDCTKTVASSNSKSNHNEKVLHPKPKISSTSRKGCRTYSGKRKPKKEVIASNSKRRRIMAMDSSSESSCEEVEEMDEDPMPAPLISTIESDDEDVIPATPQNTFIDIAEMTKMKKRKLVTKTFMDDKGFFVTKKEYELTSDCSEDENPLPSSNNVIKAQIKQIIPAKKQTLSPKKKRKSPVNSKKNSPVKRVQASITSFFKRN